VSNLIQTFPHLEFLVRFAGLAIKASEMTYIQDNEEFDPETLDILGSALDGAWQRVNRDHLNGSAYAARTVVPTGNQIRTTGDAILPGAAWQ
jgi:hypothetical protein